MHSAPGRHVADSTWREVESSLAAGAVALLPVGAACKEHGLHLPMASDWLQAEWLTRRLAERQGVLAWPTLGYGYYPAFLEYPGSISVGRDTFIALVADLLDGIAAAGARACVVINTGVSTIAPLEAAACARERRPMTLRLAHVSEGEHYRRAREQLQEQRRGGHADECETSVMLALAPERVALEQALPADAVEMEPGPLRRTNAGARNFSPTGAYGDPTLASRDKGRALLDAMLVDIEAQVQAAAADPAPAGPATP